MVSGVLALILKFDLWFEYLSLNVPAVNPTYDFEVLVSVLVTLAWYITPDFKHSPLTGQMLFLLHWN